MQEHTWQTAASAPHTPFLRNSQITACMHNPTAVNCNTLGQQLFTGWLLQQRPSTPAQKWLSNTPIVCCGHIGDQP